MAVTITIKGTFMYLPKSFYYWSFTIFIYCICICVSWAICDSILMCETIALSGTWNGFIPTPVLIALVFFPVTVKVNEIKTSHLP